MNFIDSVKICFAKYADFNGCASRPEFWWWMLFTFVATGVLQGISYNWSWAFSVATLLPTVAVTARRLHDTDRSGWLVLLWFVPLMGWIILIIFCAEQGKPNRYGGSPQGSTFA
jgi:uncharacterized membrane protein YhaH (DUF805 family)